MNNKTPIRALLILFALVLSAAAQPQTITGKVVGVSDGDTITVLDDQKRQCKIRLDGIDAPESNQEFGSRAKQSLSDLVFGKTVTVTGVTTTLETYTHVSPGMQADVSEEIERLLKGQK